MNTNTRNDPMLSSFISDDWVKLTGTLSTTASPALSVVISQPSTFLASADENLSPDHNFSDLAAMWSNERRRVCSVKMEDDDSFSSYSVAEDVDEGDTDMGEIDIGGSATVTNIKIEIEDCEYGGVPAVGSGDVQEFKFETSKSHMTEAEARRFVEEQFEKIAFVPKPSLSQREKIESIVAKSDCRDFSVEDIMNFDKKCPDSARACAKIVQNIPQRYRWECVQPEDIPCCYTIVADCKKVSSRDKPPRPMNAFMIWAQGARRLINELCPKMQNAIISEALGYYWREKTDAFKQRFEQEKLKLRIFHNVEFPEYKYKPKTKVQKAKEKQQLSITKAKIRASVKQEKLKKTEEAHIRRTNTSGRPKKMKQNSPTMEVNNSPLSPMLLLEKAPRKSPTKPAIKDMLTMKILNDRKYRGVSRVTTEPRELYRSVFGQMSPIEATDIDVDDSADDGNEKTDNITSLETAAPPDKAVSGKGVPPSVFDTPANTPPVEDVSDDRHSTPPLSQHASSTPPSQETRSNLPPNGQTLAPIPADHALALKDDHGLSLLDLVSRGATLSSVKHRSASIPAQVVDVTEWLYNFISQSVCASDHSSSSKYSLSSGSSIPDSNNNNSDLNNNNTDLPASSVHNRTNSKLDSPTDTNDLDTLLLDLNAPFLSDDDLRSILSTL